MAFASYTAKPGLFLHIDAGTLLLNGVLVSLASAELAVTANATVYVFIDLVGQVVSSNTTGFPANSFPLSVLTTTSDRVSNIVDNRPDYTVSVA